MEDEVVEELTKSAPFTNINRAPIAVSCKRELISFIRLITERSESKYPRARDISSYIMQRILNGITTNTRKVYNLRHYKVHLRLHQHQWHPINM